MPARPCLFVACAPSGSRIHPPYVKLFRKHCPAESTRIVERPKNQGPEQLPFMIYHSHRLAIPSNTEYSVDEVRMMMAEVEAILGRSVTEVALPLVAIRG